VRLKFQRASFFLGVRMSVNLATYRETARTGVPIR
jgi:hypothetical protein